MRREAPLRRTDRDQVPAPLRARTRTTGPAALAAVAAPRPAGADQSSSPRGRTHRRFAGEVGGLDAAAVLEPDTVAAEQVGAGGAHLSERLRRLECLCLGSVLDGALHHLHKAGVVG